MQPNPTHGGARKGAGRKAKDGAAGLTRFSVTLDRTSADKLRLLGGGNLSAGIRLAAATFSIVTLQKR